ncbi:MAG: DnaJ domain-containing protein [Nitrosopumilus sp.]|nr:DnaJ domain-containing protein [Nitrosopumilus sp.]
MDTRQAQRTLGVDAGSSMDEIKAAYRRLALEHHPDRSGSAGDQQFKTITEAYNRLRDGAGDAPRQEAGRPERRKDGRADGRSGGRADDRSDPEGGRRDHGAQWGAPGATPEEDWSRYTREAEEDPGFWKEYERRFWEDYEARMSRRNGAAGSAGDPDGGPDGGPDGEPEGRQAGGQAGRPRESGRRKKSGPRAERPPSTRAATLNVRVDESLCIGCCSCEVMAPGVFHIDRKTQLNPKSSVVDPAGARADVITDAARTCPTKAITVEDIASGQRLFPY